jgi:hypothetical protein
MIKNNIFSLHLKKEKDEYSNTGFEILYLIINNIPIYEFKLSEISFDDENVTLNLYFGKKELAISFTSNEEIYDFLKDLHLSKILKKEDKKIVRISNDLKVLNAINEKDLVSNYFYLDIYNT